MDQVRRILTAIQVHLSKLTLSQRLLIGSVVVVMLMTLFLVQQYASQPGLVPLFPGQSAEDQQAVAQFLRTQGVEAVDRNGVVHVPAGEATALRAQLAQEQILPSDGRVMFDNLIDKQSWTMSQRQNEQLATIAVQNELNKIVSHMAGVRGASVILHIPDNRGGLGRASEESSASVTVMPTNSLDQKTVDAVAGLIAASRGIPIENVRVIDARNNRQWKPRSENDYAASDYLEQKEKTEQLTREDLYEMLSYIEGVIISVRAQVDNTRVRTESQHVPEAGKGSATLVTSETTTEMEQTEAVRGGEPGARSNTQLDIAGTTGASGTGLRESTTETEFEAFAGVDKKRIDDPRGYARKINAVVNIPRSYFVKIWAERQGEDAEEPTDEQLEPIRVAEITRIRTEVEKMIDTSAAGENTVPGEVEVSMIPVGYEIASESVQAGSPLMGPGAPMQAWVKTLGLGLLALVSLGLVVLTALKASRREPLPSASELVGIPPALGDEQELVGEAFEADSQLEGVELSDEDIKRRKQLEQVAEMVKESPDQAATVLTKWIAESA